VVCSFLSCKNLPKKVVYKFVYLILYTHFGDFWRNILYRAEEKTNTLKPFHQMLIFFTHSAKTNRLACKNKKVFRMEELEGVFVNPTQDTIFLE
jgi:hypothetical protein